MVIYVCIVVISLCYDIQEELQSDMNGHNISLLLVFKLLQVTHFFIPFVKSQSDYYLNVHVLILNPLTINIAVYTIDGFNLKVY